MARRTSALIISPDRAVSEVEDACDSKKKAGLILPGLYYHGRTPDGHYGIAIARHKTMGFAVVCGCRYFSLWEAYEHWGAKSRFMESDLRERARHLLRVLPLLERRAVILDWTTLYHQNNLGGGEVA